MRRSSPPVLVALALAVTELAGRFAVLMLQLVHPGGAAHPWLVHLGWLAPPCRERTCGS
jgi:hypothetical protein